MLPSSHIILGIIFSTVLLLSGIPLWQALIIFSAAVLIDADHYLIYVRRKGDWNLRNSFNYFTDLGKKYKDAKNIKAPFAILHSVEILGVIGLISIYSRFFLLILVGFLFHCLVDALDMLLKGKLFAREHSLFLYLKRRKKGNLRYIEYD
jgi:hypothetical protein